jgi:DNA-directed RNA polymerase specialized sigma24 family protein
VYALRDVRGDVRPLCGGENCPQLARLHTVVVFTAAEILAHALEQLSPELRSVVEAHVFDDQSVYTLVRRRGLPKRDIESTLAAAFDAMRYALVRRGVRGVGDVV